MIKKAFFIAFIFVLFAGCSNKLNLLAPYKEMVSVYGLLDSSDATHYIRIERVFEGEGNAYTFAENPDSVYFQHGDLIVTLEYWRGGIKNATYTLSDTVMQEASGIFNQNERVYKTKQTLYAYDPTIIYKLVIHNNKNGKEFTSQTGMIGPFQLLSATTPPNVLQKGSPLIYPQTKINIVPGNNTEVHCIYNSPANSGVCSLDIQLLYTDNNGGINAQQIANISLGTLYPLSTSGSLGGSTEDFSYQGTSLLSEIAAVIPVDNNSTNTRTLNTVQFVLSAGGVDLALYNQVNTSTSLSQSKANYSNINGGVGIFSSRHKIIMQRGVTDQAIDTLSANKQTCKLRFNNINGLPSPCH